MTVRLPLLALTLAIASRGGAGSATVAAQETVRVAGVVSDEGTGTPVEGAAVRLADSSGSVREAITGREGRFAFERVAPGEYLLGVWRIGYEELQTPLDVGPDGIAPLDVRLTAEAIPLEPLNVDVEGRPPRLMESGFYDRMEEGWGTYYEPDWIEANKAGYDRVGQFLATLQLRAPLSRCPYVPVYFDRRRIGKAGGSGTSKPSSIDTLATYNPYAMTGPPPTLLGELSVADLGAAELYTPHSKLPFFAWNADTVTCGAIILWSDWTAHTNEIPKIEVKLCEPAGSPGVVTLEGVVEDEISEVRLPAAHVFASYTPPARLERQRTEVRTDLLGRYRLCDLPSGAEVELSVRYGPHAGIPRVADAAADAEVRLTVPVTLPASITGVVLTEGSSEPLEAARVTLVDTDFAAVTNADGRFSVEDLPPGRYRVRASCRGFTGPVRAVELPEGGSATVVITLRRMSFAEGERCAL
ncbi:carboxypeptidase regulatory-like domain-containing protein [Candidatus Palauibacter sp.]|uniref:carboxypeptidase regulatory-like domain-containing protein n=1 Tax=Candidatus Palauibacter sp. TaxID=3101350 RepID=UPI003C701157